MNKIKILFVGFPFSIHTARWIANFIDTEKFDIHLISSIQYDYNIHPSLKEITYHVNRYELKSVHEGIVIKPLDILGRFNLNFNITFLNRLFKIIFRKLSLVSKLRPGIIKTIRSLKPDIIHTLESQSAGYILSDIYQKENIRIPWIHSVWGIDFDYYIENEYHRSKLESMLVNIKILFVEGTRDVIYAQKLGYKNKIEIMQSTGGISSKDIKKICNNTERKIILLKGYDEKPRLGINGFHALLNCIDLINQNNLQVVIYSCGEKLTHLINEYNRESLNSPFRIAEEMSREEFIDLNLKSLITININDTDGMPNSILEGMANGAIPIASNKSCLNDIIENNENGFLLNPYDINEISNCIKWIVNNKSLLEDIRIKNQQLIISRYNFEEYRDQIQRFYKSLVTL
jgi:glycosyltransferase involved in cell wall biosynthesis